MYVYRQTYHIQHGRINEFIQALFKAAENANTASSWEGITMRWYRSEFGLFSVVAVEIEFETLEAYHDKFADWTSSEDYITFWAPLNEFIVHGGNRELWTLIEQ